MIRIAAIATFTAAMLSGTFTVSRVADAFQSASVGQVRIWLILSSAFLVMIMQPKEPESRTSVRLAIVVTALCLFLGVHARLLGAVDFRDPYILNLLHLLAMIWLAANLFRTPADSEAFAWCLLFAALATLPVWFMKSPPFGSITLYRIEFLGLMAALYLAMTRNAWLYLAAPVFLFGTLASVSKAAVAFAIVAVCYATFLLSVLRQPIAKVVVALVVGVGLFCAILLPTFMPRLNKMAQPTTFPRQLSNEVTINDASQRIRMALHAYDIAKQNPLWGAGIGAYHIELMNSDENGFDVYRYPHNVTMEIAYSTGLAGLAVYFAALFVFMVSLHQRVIASPPVAVIAAGAVFVILTSHISGDFYDMRFFWLLLIPDWTIKPRVI